MPGKGVVSTGPSSGLADPAWSSAAIAPVSPAFADFFSQAPPIRSGAQINARSAFDTRSL
jgi:hypothetical protein